MTTRQPPRRSGSEQASQPSPSTTISRPGDATARLTGQQEGHSDELARLAPAASGSASASGSPLECSWVWARSDEHARQLDGIARCQVCCTSACEDPLRCCNVPPKVGTCSDVAAQTPTPSPHGLIAGLALRLVVAAMALWRRTGARGGRNERF